MEIKAITEAIIGSAITIHSAFGPGLLESTYERCMAYELTEQGFTVERQVILPLVYRGIAIDAGYRLDMRVANAVIVEVKSVERILLVHQAQLLSYLRLTGMHVGLLINFNVVRLVDGIKRMILD